MVGKDRIIFGFSYFIRLSVDTMLIYGVDDMHFISFQIRNQSEKRNFPLGIPLFTSGGGQTLSR